jgi:alkylhydroperoxidase family enzyme
VSSRLGTSTEKIDALNDYTKSPLFSDAEKVALEYADAITVTDRDVDDELFARVQRHYDDDTIAELTMIIAWENASSRFNGRSASHRKGSGSDDGHGPRDTIG